MSQANNIDPNTLTLSLEKAINAPIEQVFNAWLDAEILAKFMIPMQGMCEPQVTCTPSQGGNFEILMKAGDTVLPHTGEYLTITPYSRIVFTWQSSNSIDGSQVTLKFEQTGDTTTLRLDQVKFFDQSAKDNHSKGWQSILNQLEAFLVV
jgi:uncharacterized protein YndB with AHSA1/START domain